MKYRLLKHIELNDSLEIWAEFIIEDHRTTLDVDFPDCSVSIEFLIAQWYIEKVEDNLDAIKFYIGDKVIFEYAGEIIFSEVKHIRLMDWNYMYYVWEQWHDEHNIKLASDECQNKKSKFYNIFPFI